MFKFNRSSVTAYFAKLKQLQSCEICCYSTIEMPKCDYQPRQYVGPSYEKMKKIRETHIMPCVTTNYKEPLLIHEGKMQWLFDHTGKRYLDMFAGIVTVSVGHCHPKVVKAATEQMNKLWHTTNIYMHPKIHEYAEKLTAKFPGDLKVTYFVNSGSEANDLAMLLARLHTKNFDIISFRNAYHGMSPYTMGLSALSTWRYNIPVSQGIHHAMNPDVYQGIWGGKDCRDSPVQTSRQCNCSSSECLATEMYYRQLEDIFKYSLPRGKVAGFFAESIQGVGGTVQFPKGYLKKAYELVRINGGICIADEGVSECVLLRGIHNTPIKVEVYGDKVQTGFGRTGEHFWGFEMHGVKPDIVTVAKGIGNGFPLAAVITTPRIAESMTQALHFNTFGGNPMACAVGLSVLEVMEEEQTQENCRIVGTHLLNRLAALRDKFSYVGDVRGKGLMIGIELVSDKETKTPLPAKQFMDIWEDCKDMGVLLGRGGLYGNVLRIKPPMCITKEDADFTLEVLEKALKNYMQKKMKKST